MGRGRKGGGWPTSTRIGCGRSKRKRGGCRGPACCWPSIGPWARGHLADVYVVGADDYFDRIIELAGGQNAYQQRGVRYPVVSSEGILWLNPDVIVDLVPKSVLQETDRKTLVADWDELAGVEAVKNHRVLVFDQDYDFVPGPRFIRLVEDLARMLHPEVKWERGK